MSKLSNEQQLSWLVETYFSDSVRTISLQAGDQLMHCGHPNDRLYYIHSGAVCGFDDETNPDGSLVVKLKSGPGDFVGLHSFFSDGSLSNFTIEADADCELAYIDRDHPVISNVGASSLAEQFMPVVVRGMVYRQQFMQEMGRQQEKVYAQVHEYERLASLGQLSAGVAHELNNSVAVIVRGCDWLSVAAERGIAKKGALHLEYFCRGRDQGRVLSTREIRQRKKELQIRYKLDAEEAEKIATMGLEELPRKIQKNLDELSRIWEIGATINDLKLASNHAEHVVNSMKTLGAGHENMEEGIDLNETIREALTLVHSKLRRVQLDLDLTADKPIHGNRGALVQVWVNLLKNAAEACQENPSEQSCLFVRTNNEPRTVVVELMDNGPGISPEILPKIFQPNVTTKKKGLSFGLGLGLTIVQRLVNEHQGKISVQSTAGKTVFRVEFPV